jgi:hypothetical protein
MPPGYPELNKNGKENMNAISIPGFIITSGLTQLFKAA